jgi:two-component sensor histidine kinase
MLSLQSDVIDNSAAKEALQESRLRINSMSLIHQMLYNKSNMSSINLSEYLAVLLSQIEKSYTPVTCNISAILKCDAITIDLDTAIPLGLIVNELVTNAYKHAFKNANEGTIEVVFNKTEENYHLIVKDNGSGFDAQNAKNQSLGMELIQMLAEQLNGSLKFTNHTGTKAEITFKA